MGWEGVEAPVNLASLLDPEPLILLHFLRPCDLHGKSGLG